MSEHFLGISQALPPFILLFFGEIIITDPIAVYFSYRKDQHALVKPVADDDISSANLPV